MLLFSILLFLGRLHWEHLSFIFIYHVNIFISFIYHIKYSMLTYVILSLNLLNFVYIVDVETVVENTKSVTLELLELQFFFILSQPW